MRPGARSPQFERDFLDAAERQARSMGSGFVDLVTDRLTENERAKGTDSYLDQGLLGCLRMIDDQAADLGGWPALAALIANDEIVDADTKLLVVTLLQQIAALGVHAHQIVQQLQRVLHE